VDPDLDWDRVGSASMPDPDRYQVQANEKVDKLTLFSRKFQYYVKNTENHGTLDTDEKDTTL
jgi:hypothetical protein